MREQLEQRLKQLKSEFEAGQKMLAEMEAKQAAMREALLRISEAIAVIEEELAEGDLSPSEPRRLTRPQQ